MTPVPVPEHLDGEAIHQWFSLSYSNYLVLTRTQLQSMDALWQTRFVRLLHELGDAFPTQRVAPCYQVQPAREREVSELTAARAQSLGVTIVEPEDEEGDVQYFYQGEEVDADYRVLVPMRDPVPAYNRGRTTLERAPVAPVPYETIEQSLRELRLELATATGSELDRYRIKSALLALLDDLNRH